MDILSLYILSQSCRLPCSGVRLARERHPGAGNSLLLISWFYIRSSFHSLVSLSICLRNWARVSFVRHQLRSRGVRFRWCFLFLWSLGEFAAAVYGGCSLFLEFKEWICDFRFSDLSLGSHPPCGRDLSASVKLLSWWCCLAAVVVFEVLFGVVEVQFLPNAVEWAPEVSTSSEASLGSSYAGGDGDSVLFLTCEITAVFLKGVVYGSSMFARHLSSLQICSTWSCFGTFG